MKAFGAWSSAATSPSGRGSGGPTAKSAVMDAVHHGPDFPSGSSPDPQESNRSVGAGSRSARQGRRMAARPRWAGGLWAGPGQSRSRGRWRSPAAAVRGPRGPAQASQAQPRWKPPAVAQRRPSALSAPRLRPAGSGEGLIRLRPLAWALWVPLTAHLARQRPPGVPRGWGAAGPRQTGSSTSRRSRRRRPPPPQGPDRAPAVPRASGGRWLPAALSLPSPAQ